MRRLAIIILALMASPAAAQMDPSDVWVWLQPAPPAQIYRTPPERPFIEHRRHRSMESWKRSIAGEVRAYCKVNPRDSSCPHR
jgi:hypothetical protein